MRRVEEKAGERVGKGEKGEATGSVARAESAGRAVGARTKDAERVRRVDVVLVA